MNDTKDSNFGCFYFKNNQPAHTNGFPVHFRFGRNLFTRTKSQRISFDPLYRLKDLITDTDGILWFMFKESDITGDLINITERIFGYSQRICFRSFFFCAAHCCFALVRLRAGDFSMYAIHFKKSSSLTGSPGREKESVPVLLTIRIICLRSSSCNAVKESIFVSSTVTVFI